MKVQQLSKLISTSYFIVFNDLYSIIRFLETVSKGKIKVSTFDEIAELVEGKFADYCYIPYSCYGRESKVGVYKDDIDWNYISNLEVVDISEDDHVIVLICKYESL